MITRSFNGNFRQRLLGKALLVCTVAGALIATSIALPALPAMAQNGNKATGPLGNAPQQQPLPNSVLLFPAVIMGEGGAAAPATPAGDNTEEIVTDAVRKYLSRAGVGVVVYNRRLPSVQRAVGEASIKAEDAASGPGDDVQKAQQFAQLLGANEYLTATIENYKYDPQARSVTFNLSVERRAASDAVSLGASAEKATGAAPQDVAGTRQEGSAVARAAEVVAEQSVLAIYPQSAAILNPPKETKENGKRKQKRVSGAAIIIPAVALLTFLVGE